MRLSFGRILNNIQFMGFSTILEGLDRLSAKSVLRGSTATIAGLIGTLAVIILCFTIYLPAAISILDGEYFETEFYTNAQTSQRFTTSSDIKIAIAYRNKYDNSLANHSAIQEFTYNVAEQDLPDWSGIFYQPMKLCSDNLNYFTNQLYGQKLKDCFIFPQNKLLNLFTYYGYKTDLYYFIQSKFDPNPFTVNTLTSYQARLQKLLEDYYMEVYFTSKIINSQGKNQFVLHRFYSTEVQPTSLVGTSWNMVVYGIRNTSMDLSIMPWRNSKNVSNLVWLGEVYNLYLLSDQQAARYGATVYFNQEMYQIRTFRYYKKVDFLAGIIGGAMLLFYLILWVPCNYINRNLHKIRNAQHLLLIADKSNKKQQLLEEDLYPARVGWNYWISNPIFNYFSFKLRRVEQLVRQAELQLDIVWLIKKLKIIERNLIKKELNIVFKPKIIDLKKRKIDNQQAQASIQVDSQILQSQADIVQRYKVEEQDFQKVQVDYKFGLTPIQRKYIQQTSQQQNALFINNLTAKAIRQQKDSMKIMEYENKNRQDGAQKGKISKAKYCFQRICDLIQYMDFFGVRPNLSPGQNGSSFIGFCNTLVIIILTCLTVGLTVANANQPQYMILENFVDENNFGYKLTPGVDLKFAICSGGIQSLVGSSKSAMIRYFYQNSDGRTYLNPTQLSRQQYAFFDVTVNTFPYDTGYCLTMKANSSFFMGQRPDNYGYFGFRIQPSCTSTSSYCEANKEAINKKFVDFMNRYYVYLFMPQNRFDPERNTFINNLIPQPLNVNSFYLNNLTYMQETLFVDNVRIEDDTRNFFMRREPDIIGSRIAINANTPYPLSKMQNSSSIYYQLKIKPSSRQINYIIYTPKADTILGIIGGVVVLWYAICHWLGKAYNNYQIRTAKAAAIYEEDAHQQNIAMKMVAISPIPLCLIPECFDIKQTIIRMRQVDRKIIDNLHYLWLVKYVSNLYQLSSQLFTGTQLQYVSKIFFKEKIDESKRVVQLADPDDNLPDQFLNQNRNHDDRSTINRSSIIRNSVSNMVDESYLKQSFHKVDEKLLELDQQEFKIQQNKQKFADNYFNGHPQPFKFAWADTFQYPASLTYKGKREVTSCFGGGCCIILMVLLIIVVNFQLKIYFDRSDTKIGMTTFIMQPIANYSSQAFNSNISLITGDQFKLAITFSKNSLDSPQNVTQFLKNGVSVSIFQKQFIKKNGVITLKVNEYSLISCPRGYLTQSLDSLIDQSYYVNQTLGYCVPNGINLRISGLPEDEVRESFTLSIYNRINTTLGKQNLVKFLQNYYPKYHFSVPNPQKDRKQLAYEIASFAFDPYNITSPVQQNLTLSKLIITYDDQIGFTKNPQVLSTYLVNPFRQMETSYYGLPSQNMYYNLTFDNSFLVEHYMVKGDKFYQTFGLIGGLISFFIFGFGCIAYSFNHYRMRYLIGKQLYLFQITKKNKQKNSARGKPQKTTQQKRELRKINNLNQFDILRAYLLSIIAGIFQSYNMDPILRRVSLIQQKVDKDISLINVYKKIHTFRDSLNQKLKIDSSEYLKASDIYLKPIFKQFAQKSEIDSYPKIKKFGQMHQWSSYDQFIAAEALRARVNLREVFDNNFLVRELNIDPDSAANMSNLDPSMGNLSSINSEAMSHVEIEDN